MNLLRAATVNVADPEATAERYARWFGYEIVERGRVAPELGSSWNAPLSAGRPFIVMAPASGAEIFIRFVAGDVMPGYRPLRTLGWAAMELCVRDVLEVQEKLESSAFEIIGPPREIEGLTAIYPMQVRGPDDEIVFLTQIRSDLPQYELPRASTLIDHLFIAVMGCANLSAVSSWFERQLRLSPGREMDVVYSVLARAFGSPLEQKYRLNTLTHGRNVFLEVDQYPAAATHRAAHPGQLPPGIAAVTLCHPDFSSLDGFLSAPARHSGVIYAGREAACMRTPEGALVELVGGD